METEALLLLLALLPLEDAMIPLATMARVASPYEQTRKKNDENPLDNEMPI